MSMFFVSKYRLSIRTARADNPGTALAFISHTERPLLAEIQDALTGGQLAICGKVYLLSF